MVTVGVVKVCYVVDVMDGDQVYGLVLGVLVELVTLHVQLAIKILVHMSYAIFRVLHIASHVVNQ
jgi:uncharacterized protein (UPF0548 family)